MIIKNVSQKKTKKAKKKLDYTDCSWLGYHERTYNRYNDYVIHIYKSDNAEIFYDVHKIYLDSINCQNLTVKSKILKNETLSIDNLEYYAVEFNPNNCNIIEQNWTKDKEDNADDINLWLINNNKKIKDKSKRIKLILRTTKKTELNIEFIDECVLCDRHFLKRDWYNHIPNGYNCVMDNLAKLKVSDTCRIEAHKPTKEFTYQKYCDRMYGRCYGYVYDHRILTDGLIHSKKWTQKYPNLSDTYFDNTLDSDTEDEFRNYRTVASKDYHTELNMAQESWGQDDYIPPDYRDIKPTIDEKIGKEVLRNYYYFCYENYGKRMPDRTLEDLRYVDTHFTLSEYKDFEQFYDDYPDIVNDFAGRNHEDMKNFIENLNL